MANPQIENGYVRIANDFHKALCRTRIPGEARQCLDVIILKTWGFNKRFDHIALSQFQQITGLSRSHCYRGITKLAQMNMIAVEKNNLKGNCYRVNKDYDTWLPLYPVGETPQKSGLAVPRTGQTCPPYGGKSVPVRGNTKDISKDILQKTGIFFQNTKNPTLERVKKTLQEKGIIKQPICKPNPKT